MARQVSRLSINDFYARLINESRERKWWNIFLKAARLAIVIDECLGGSNLCTFRISINFSCTWIARETRKKIKLLKSFWISMKFVLITNRNVSSVCSGPSEEGITKTFACARALVGQYVFLQLVGVEGSLSLCEVEVFATDGKLWI